MSGLPPPYSPATGITAFQDRTATLGGGGGLTSFGTDAYGEIYYTRGAGEVRKIVPVSPQGPDCNANGRRDACDIADGSSADADRDQVPDECSCAAETCDNLDNDCDGTIDGFATSCGVGECAASGTCTAGVDSCVAGLPAAELCDGLDNDCDGTPDNVAAPVGQPSVRLSRHGNNTPLSWTAVVTATAYDIVRGDLTTLRSTAGDFTAATNQCTANDWAATSVPVTATPAAGNAFFFLVRAVNCGGNGTYDEPSQVGLRDAEVDAAPAACP